MFWLVGCTWDCWAARGRCACAGMAALRGLCLNSNRINSDSCFHRPALLTCGRNLWRGSRRSDAREAVQCPSSTAAVPHIHQKIASRTEQKCIRSLRKLYSVLVVAAASTAYAVVANAGGGMLASATAATGKLASSAWNDVALREGRSRTDLGREAASRPFDMTSCS